MFPIILLFSLFVPGIIGNGHPLDPLTQTEILDSAAIVRASNPNLFKSGDWAFNWITLREPEKSLLLKYFLNDQDPPPTFSNLGVPRKSIVVLLERRRHIVNEVVVNLDTRTVESWTRVPDGAKVAYSNEDSDDAPDIAKADPEVQNRCRQLGWVNMSLVSGETWGVGYAKDRPVLRDAIRPIQCYMYGQLFDGENHFDLALRKVIQIDDLPTHADYNAANKVDNVCPTLRSDYNPALRPTNFLRTNLNPIHFSQPNGASYQIRGHEITWQKFKLRVGFNGREGLVIHHVSYKDGPVTRPLFYRLAVGEVFVPYGDARPPFHQKFPFDMGEFTFGNSAVDLKTAGLCRGGGVVAYMDFTVHDESPTPIPLPAAVCIHEEDAGLLWAHWTSDSSSGDRVFHARSQRLVITCISNLGNYDYLFSWRFYQDGSIDFHVQLHGMISSQMLAKGVSDAGEFGDAVFPQINGQYHQHFFALRIDPEIDGNENSVSTLDVVPLPDPTGSPRNPYGQGFITENRLLETPAEARTSISPSRGRSWIIRNPNKINVVSKQPVSWRLVPFNSPSHFVRKDSPMHPLAAWLDYNVWVLKYKDYQLYPTGFYQNGGLVEWVNSDPNANITNADVVLWFLFGITHLPRTEDFPLIPVESATVVLKPTNFFVENPGLDVPPPASC